MANPNPRTDHLKPHQFKEGNSGLPGRPPKIREDIITRKALELLLKPHPKHPDRTRLDVLAEKWIDRTESGEGFSELLARVDGPLVEKSESTVNVNPDQPTTDAEIDGWAKERAQALAAETTDSPAEPSGLRSANREGKLAVDEAPQSPQ